MIVETDLAKEIARRIAIKHNFIDHIPHPKQQKFLDLTCKEALYGGAAGSGKSDALLMAAAAYIHVPGYAGLILRRTYRDLALPGAIMDRAKEWWIKHGIHWNDQDKRFTFPSNATITFGYLDNEQDRFRYQGAELQFIAFDELTQFPKHWYTYLLSRLRKLSDSPIIIRARATANPGGIGHDWVKERFIDSTDPDIQFVAALLKDNPSLNQTEYEAQLSRLDPITRQQLLEGKWIKDTSGLVYHQYSDELCIATEIPELTYFICGIDFGIQDENAITILGWREHDPCTYVITSYRRKGLVSEMAEEVLNLEKKYKFVQIVGDTGGMGKAFTEEMVKRYSLPIKAADKNNKLGYISLLNGELSQGKIRLDIDRCLHLVEEWASLYWNDSRTKEADGCKNHASDSMLYAWRAALAYPGRPQKDKPKPNTEEYFIQLEEQLMENAKNKGQQNIAWDHEW